MSRIILDCQKEKDVIEHYTYTGHIVSSRINRMAIGGADEPIPYGLLMHALEFLTKAHASFHFDNQGGRFDALPPKHLAYPSALAHRLVVMGCYRGATGRDLASSVVEQEAGIRRMKELVMNLEGRTTLPPEKRKDYIELAAFFSQVHKSESVDVAGR